MKNKWLYSMMLVVVLILSSYGCGGAEKNDSKTGSGEPVIEMLDISFEINPHAPKVAEQATITSMISKKDSPVEHADVVFELWKDGEAQHEKINASYNGEGVYSIQKTFEQAGNYRTIIHVTTPELHQMIEKPFEIVPNGDHAENSAPSHHHDHHDGITIHLMSEPDQFEKGKEMKLTAHIMKGQEVIEDATVLFEIWKDNEEKHIFLETTPIENAMYYSNYIFEESGVYHINVHVEKGEIHSHLNHEIEVK